MVRLLGEVQELTRASIAAARAIEHRGNPGTLGDLVKRGLAERPEAYHRLRIAVHARLAELGEVGRERSLIMLAADMATTAALYGHMLADAERRALRRLWDGLRGG